MRNYSLYLKDILAAIQSIDEFVADMDYEAFRSDDKTSSAVIRKFEIIGEATRYIPEDIRLFPKPQFGYDAEPARIWNTTQLDVSTTGIAVLRKRKSGI